MRLSLLEYVTSREKREKMENFSDTYVVFRTLLFSKSLKPFATKENY